MKKQALLFAALPVLAIALLAGGITHASTTDTAKPNPFGKLAEAIASKFNLSTSSVQAVIDETMSKDRPPIGQNHEPKIDMVKKAVADGKLTQAQADLIYAKRAEIKTAMDSYKTLSQSDRETAVKTLMDSVKQWAKDNNIPAKHVLPPGGPRNGHRGDRPAGNTADSTGTTIDPTATDSTTTDTSSVQ